MKQMYKKKRLKWVAEICGSLIKSVIQVKNNSALYPGVKNSKLG